MVADERQDEVGGDGRHAVEARLAELALHVVPAVRPDAVLTTAELPFRVTRTQNVGKDENLGKIPFSLLSTTCGAQK